MFFAFRVVLDMNRQTFGRPWTVFWGWYANSQARLVYMQKTQQEKLRKDGTKECRKGGQKGGMWKSTA